MHQIAAPPMNEIEPLLTYVGKFSGMIHLYKLISASTLLKSNEAISGFEAAISYATEQGLYRISKYIESITTDMRINGFVYNKNIGLR